MIFDYKIGRGDVMTGIAGQTVLEMAVGETMPLMSLEPLINPQAAKIKTRLRISGSA
jgi:hypothetical protein